MQLAKQWSFNNTGEMFFELVMVNIIGKMRESGFFFKFQSRIEEYIHLYI